MKSIHGSCPASIPASCVYRSIIALWSFAFGDLSGGGDIELNFFVKRRTVLVVSVGSLYSQPFGHGLYLFPSESRCVEWGVVCCCRGCVLVCSRVGY